MFEDPNNDKNSENEDKNESNSSKNIKFKSQMQINVERLYTLNEVEEEYKSHVSDVKGMFECSTQTNIIQMESKEVETDSILPIIPQVILPQSEQSQKTSLFKKFKQTTVDPLNIIDPKPKIKVESDEFEQSETEMQTDLSKFPLLSGLSKINEQNLANMSANNLAKTQYINSNKEYQLTMKNKDSTSNLVQLPSVYYPKVDEVKLQPGLKTSYGMF